MTRIINSEGPGKRRNQQMRTAAELLRRHGCSGEVVLGAEPGLPITFVRTDALKNSALVFRKHVLKMGARPPAWTPREPKLV